MTADQKGGGGIDGLTKFFGLVALIGGLLTPFVTWAVHSYTAPICGITFRHSHGEPVIPGPVPDPNPQHPKPGDEAECGPVSLVRVQAFNPGPGAIDDLVLEIVVPNEQHSDGKNVRGVRVEDEGSCTWWSDKDGKNCRIFVRPGKSKDKSAPLIRANFFGVRFVTNKANWRPTKVLLHQEGSRVEEIDLDKDIAFHPAPLTWQVITLCTVALYVGSFAVLLWYKNAQIARGIAEGLKAAQADEAVKSVGVLDILNPPTTPETAKDQVADAKQAILKAPPKKRTKKANNGSEIDRSPNAAE